MGKLHNQLQKQLNNTEYKNDAKKCLIIYNKLIDISDGRVWSSDWSALTNVNWVDNNRVYKPTKIGEIFLLGVETLK